MMKKILKSNIVLAMLIVLMGGILFGAFEQRCENIHIEITDTIQE